MRALCPASAVDPASTSKGSAAALSETVHLHDAEVRWGPADHDLSRFVILAYPEDDPGGMFVLIYQLQQPGSVRKPSAMDHAEWLYDEIEIIDRGGLLFHLFHPKVFRHSILLSNGAELVIDFTDMWMVHVRERVPVA